MMDDDIIELSGVRYAKREDSVLPVEPWAERGIRDKPDNHLPQYPWTVVDRRGVCVLICVDHPGVQFTTKEITQQLSEAWNAAS